jgi:hypothetical protein
MSRDELRVRNHSEREDIKNLTEKIIASHGFGVVYQSEPIISAFAELMKATMDDFDEQTTRRNGTPINDFTPTERNNQINLASRCAFSYFNENVPNKFQTAFMELISESLAFADSVYVQKSGGDEKQIDKARPTSTDLQQNVLWWSIQRQRRLSTRRRVYSSEWIEADPEIQPLNRAVYEIFNNLVLWVYDHVHMQDLLRQSIRPMVSKYDDPDSAAFNLANEAAELIWENIDGAAQMMSSVLVVFCHMLAFQSIEQQHNVEYPDDQIQVRAPISATKLKEISAPFLDSWFEVMSVKLNKPGRPSRNPVPEDQNVEQAKFIQDVKNAIRSLKVVDKGSIGLKLGYGKSREKLEPTKESAARALREKAKRLQVNIDDLLPEKKDRKKNQK